MTVLHEVKHIQLTGQSHCSYPQSSHFSNNRDVELSKRLFLYNFSVMERINNDKENYRLKESAKEILAKNSTGRFTKPTDNLYPHQWSWDAGFIAMGYAHYNQSAAARDLLHLFNGQWNNGMVPHIIFDDRGFEDKYFPGPSFWKTGNIPNAPDSVFTSGICQPPIHATAVHHIVRLAQDREKALSFADTIYPKIVAWHNYLYRERDIENDGLVYIRHPWESGQDNSPLWDPILNRMEIDSLELPVYLRKDIKHIHASERPTNLDYDRYIYLLDFFSKNSYDEKNIRENGCPFLVEDVLFNTILAKANRDLGEVAKSIGKSPERWFELSEKTSQAVDQKLWCEEKEFYVNFDLNRGTQIHERVLAGFLPIYAGIPSNEKAERLFNYLNTHCFCRLDDVCYAAPSYDRSSPEYSESKYWRGPIWINLNWMLCIGLDNYGYSDYARRIMNSIIQLPSKSGFHEYFDPDTGSGYGSANFSWTASLLLDVLYTREKSKETDR